MLQADNFAPQAQDNEIIPWYKCGCCHDTGLVASRYLHKYVSGYNANTSKHFICRRNDCEHGKKYRDAYWTGDDVREKNSKERGGYPIAQKQYQSFFDFRLETWICDEIHNFEYKDFLNYVDNRVENKRKSAIALAGLGQIFGNMPKAP